MYGSSDECRGKALVEDQPDGEYQRIDEGESQLSEQAGLAEAFAAQSDGSGHAEDGDGGG